MRKPRHGYEMMEKIDKRFNGEFRVGPASLYTTLKQLHKNKLCQYEVIGKRKVYSLTQEGNRLFEAGQQLKKEILRFVEEVAGETN
jgi:DNA-binding PadR family transcriptional regulator